ncbi:MAG: hypothetical protein ABW352_16965 [Polyangiales bacterium]
MASFGKNAGASMALAGLMFSGCYTQKTADDELLDFTGSANDAAVVVPDAGAVVIADASSAPKCAGTDPIALLLCQLTPQTQQPQQQPAVPDLTGLLDSLGGLGNIAEILGPALGTSPTRPGTTPSTAGASDLVNLVNFAGGLANIAQLFNQLLGGGGQSLPGLFAGGGTQSMQPASLADFLSGLGIPVAGAPTTITEEPTETDCANPTTPAQQFACALQAAQ